MTVFLICFVVSLALPLPSPLHAAVIAVLGVLGWWRMWDALRSGFVRARHLRFHRESEPTTYWSWIIVYALYGIVAVRMAELVWQKTLLLPWW